MVAAFHGNIGCVRTLAEKEAGMRDGFDRTALIFAAHEGHFECVEILREKEAGRQNGYGRTAMSMAAG